MRTLNAIRLSIVWLLKRTFYDPNAPRVERMPIYFNPNDR